jgi:hypothetical protein
MTLPGRLARLRATADSIALVVGGTMLAGSLDPGGYPVVAAGGGAMRWGTPRGGRLKGICDVLVVGRDLSHGALLCRS